MIWKLIYETKFSTEKRTHKSTFLYHSVDGNICTNSVRFKFSVFYSMHIVSELLTQIHKNSDASYLCMSSLEIPCHMLHLEML